MACVIEFEKKTQERLVNKIVGEFDSLYNKADDIASRFNKICLNDPVEAIERLPEFIDSTRDVNPNKGYECIAGGPNQDWIAPLMNIIGIVYPDLPREQRQKALTYCLDYLDRQNTDRAKDHVELLDEPWLVADIVINSPGCWCGYSMYVDMLNVKTWDEFSNKIESARSSFWLALAVTRYEYSSLEIRKNFYSTSPKLLDRTLDAIAGISSDHARHYNETKGTPIEEYISKSLSKYDPMLHKKIRKKMSEEKWIKV